MPVANATVQITGQDADNVFITVGSMTFSLNKAEMKEKVQNYRCTEQLRWAIILQLFSQGTDLTNAAAIKAAVESGTYFF